MWRYYRNAAKRTRKTMSFAAARNKNPIEEEDDRPRACRTPNTSERRADGNMISNDTRTDSGPVAPPPVSSSAICADVGAAKQQNGISLFEFVAVFVCLVLFRSFIAFFVAFFALFAVAFMMVVSVFAAFVVGVFAAFVVGVAEGHASAATFDKFPRRRRRHGRLGRLCERLSWRRRRRRVTWAARTPDSIEALVNSSVIPIDGEPPANKSAISSSGKRSEAEEGCNSPRRSRGPAQMQGSRTGVWLRGSPSHIPWWRWGRDRAQYRATTGWSSEAAKHANPQGPT